MDLILHGIAVFTIGYLVAGEGGVFAWLLLAVAQLAGIRVRFLSNYFQGPESDRPAESEDKCKRSVR